MLANASDSAGLYCVQVTYGTVLKQAHNQEVVRVQIHSAVEFSKEEKASSEAFAS
jgi:hypothetical protein